ncbi:chemotaxis protein CheC [Gottfriedia solisilvae]|uniref:CheY-P phosphatase CheC n=1 Tax=Gottfriedia solisilvae TaxID=1516104 RepID=A0A8J3EWM1_9BACI|nr:chemotaxis protein CheC [Gottfriedia solisilvae]GGI14180.1 CheY-P phosphatase CheC [Gottfriedia solisilvae]
MSFQEQIKSLQLDILKEIGNIGAGHAATALSNLLNTKIDMSVPNVKIMPFNDMMELVGGAENVVASVYFRIEGEAPGSMYFVTSLEQASNIIKQLTHDPKFQIEDLEQNPIAGSVLQEVGNILIGSYLSSFSDFTNLNIYPTVPALAIDMFGAIISYGLIEIGQFSDEAIVIDTIFFSDEDKENEELNGHFFLLPDPDSFEIIFNSLGLGSNE